MHVQDGIVELLRNVEIFSKLKEYELDVIARYSEYVGFEEGRLIYEEGSVADCIYIVDSGEVKVIRDNQDGDIELARIIIGESFGELELLEETSRNASAFANTKTVLLAFPRKGMDLKEIFKKHPDISARIIFKFIAIVASRIREVNQLANEKAQWIRELKKQLLTDKLTGLFSNSYIDEELAKNLPSFPGNTAIIMIKPDNFKTINDNYGHEIGDQVLQLMAIFLHSVMREEDIAIRYRGDEFSAILKNTVYDDAITIAEELKSTFNEIELTHLVNEELSIKVSIGISFYPDEDTMSDKIIAKSYERMYRARESGGDTIVYD